MKTIMFLLIFAAAAGPFVNALPNQHPWGLSLEKCYGELGCFEIGGEFMDLIRRPIQVFPQSRQNVGTKFYLFTRANSVNGRELRANNDVLLERSGFRQNRSVKFVVHGFLQSSTVRWTYDMRRDILIHQDVNVIMVDWENGAKVPYTQATANTRLVGAEISLLLKYMKRKIPGFQLADVHLIGHSLGAHICGYAGKYFPTDKIGRISGLDPAGPYFDGTKALMRIDREDASFVSVMHTNGDELLKVGFGMIQPVGDVDIYPNGGRHQAGCGPIDSIKNIIEKGAVDVVACSHMRAVYLFTSSILADCPFTAFRCKDYETFKGGRCLNCSAEGTCFSAGMKTVQPTTLHKSTPNLYFMETRPKAPYCGYHYGVKIFFSTSSKAHTGRFTVKLLTVEGDSHPTTTIPGDDEYAKVVPGGSLGGVVFSVRQLRDITSLRFEWKRKKSIWDPSSWLGNGIVEISKIDVYDVLKKSSQSYCSSSTLKTKRVHNFVKCLR